MEYVLLQCVLYNCTTEETVRSTITKKRGKVINKALILIIEYREETQHIWRLFENIERLES